MTLLKVLSLARFLHPLPQNISAVEQQQLKGMMTTSTLAELLTFPAQRRDMQTLREWELYLTDGLKYLVGARQARAK